MKLLVAAAWEPEVSHFRARAGAASWGREAVVDTVGVGLVEASIGVTRCVLQHTPTHALLIGTCGAFARAGVPLASVVSAASVSLADASVVARASELPAPMPSSAIADKSLHAALIAAGAKSVHIASTVGITIDDALAATLAGEGDVEHLEAFAFARACDAASIPWAIALGVANTVGARGRAEWREGHARASVAAADLAYDAIAAWLRTSTTAP